MKTLISIIGSDSGDDGLSIHALGIAETCGRLIAERGGAVLCGGHRGIMEAACKGAKAGGGDTIGILPEATVGHVNPFVDFAIPTDLGFKRNLLVIHGGQSVIAIAGRWGTLNEITYAMNIRKPLILIKGTGGAVDDIAEQKILRHHLQPHIVDSAEEAVDLAFGLTKEEDKKYR